MPVSKKTLGRLLHDRLVTAFYEFARERGTQEVDVVVGAFLSGAVQAIAKVECVEARKAMVHQCINHLIEHADVPLVALVGECGEQATGGVLDAMLAAAEPAGCV